MHAFEYHRPGSAKEAASLAKGEARYLAGGQSLVQAMKLRLSSPSDLIDLSSLKELTGIKVSGNAVEIGAMTRHADVAGSAEVKKAIPALASLAGQIGDRQVRHMGTIGGSLANNDPAADYPAAVLGLGATVHTNKRTIAADDFFKGMFTTALEDGEIITKVQMSGIRQGEAAKRNFITDRFRKLPIQFNINVKAQFYQLITSLKAMYDPAFIRDPREIGLIDAQGNPIRHESVAPPLPEIRPEDIQPSESRKTP